MKKQLSNLFTTFEYDMGTVCDGKELKVIGAHYHCTKQATEILIVHRWDVCDHSTTERWVPPPGGTGNEVFFYCVQCKSDTCKDIDANITRMRQQAKAKGARWLECTSCGKRINKLGDICSVEALLNV